MNTYVEIATYHGVTIPYARRSNSRRNSQLFVPISCLSSAGDWPSLTHFPLSQFGVRFRPERSVHEVMKGVNEHSKKERAPAPSHAASLLRLPSCELIGPLWPLNEGFDPFPLLNHREIAC